MSQSLGWNFSVDQARDWLHRLSCSDDSPALVLLVDGGNAASLKEELDELTSGTYGPSLRLVISVDQGMVDQLTKSTTGRQLTARGTKTTTIYVKPLDDEEFAAAETVLHSLRLIFMHGSRRSADHRIPWLLRSLIAKLSNDPKYANPSLAAALPNVPGMQPLAFAEERFGWDATLVGQHLKIAEAMLNDFEAEPPSLDYALLRMTNYVCRHDTLSRLLSDNEIAQLVSNGYLKHRVVGNYRVVIPQVPTLVASCISRLLAESLAADAANNPRLAADRLVTVCSKIPFGEIVGGYSLFQSFKKNELLNPAILERLIELKPSRQSIAPGTKGSTVVQGHRIDIEVIDERRFIAIFPDGTRHGIDTPPDDIPLQAHLDTTAWRILSYFAILPIEVANLNANGPAMRIDAWLLVEVGSCPVVLIRPEGGMFDKFKVHELGNDTTIVCHEEGIIEPITFSLYTAMSREEGMARTLVDEAIERESLPLLSRINIGLLQIEEHAGTSKAAWAARIRRDMVVPHFRDTLLDHCSAADSEG